MKILFLTHEFPPSGGGAGQNVKNLSLKYASKGYNVHILTSKYNNVPIQFSSKNIFFHYVWGTRSSELDNNIVPTFLSFLFLGSLKGYRIIKKYKIDIIHSSMAMPAGLVGVILKKIFKVPNVVSFFGSDVPYHSSSKIMIMIKPLIKYIILNTDKISVLSHGLNNTLGLTINMDEVNSSVIYSGVDLPIISKLKKKDKRKDRIKFISIGRLVKLKGFQDVIIALNEIKNDIPNWEYHIIGDGPYKNDLVSLIEKYRLQKKIKLHGFIDDIELKSQLLINSDIFVGTSHSEALGLVFLEALAHGLPVLGSSTGGIPEIINKDELGLLVKPRDINEIKNGIKKILKDLKKFNKNTLINRSKQFSWDVISNQYLGEYQKLIKKNE